MHTNIKQTPQNKDAHDKMRLHAKLSKFHIEYAQNGATVQHIHSKQDIATICQK